MNKFTIATVIIIAFILNSCEPAATFDKPQPAGLEPLASFPEHIRGNYLSPDHASVITVAAKLLVRNYDFDVKKHKDSIGSSYRLIADTLINLTDGIKEKISLNGDTIIQHENFTDTLFYISDDNILKKFKGHYFLNIRYAENAWELKKVSFENGTLTVGSISGKDDIEKLKVLTETTADTTSTHFSLTRKQFKKFVKHENFSDKESFTRMAENRM